MEISKLMAVMNTVEEDHRQVLDTLKELRESLETLSGTDSPCTVLKRLHEVNAGFAARFARHASDEERTLFPFLAENLPEETELVNELEREHQEIITKFGEFQNCLDVGDELEDKVPHAILLDVLAFGWELLDLMDRHAHHETSAVQRCFSKFVQSVPGM